MFDRVMVRPDVTAPLEGPFAYGLEWARRLRLALRVLSSDGETSAFVEGVAACQKHGVSMDEPGQGMEFSSSSALYVCRQGSKQLSIEPQPIPQAGGIPKATLRCPMVWRPSERILVLNVRQSGDSLFLGMAKTLCRRIGSKMVILNWATSENEAASLRATAMAFHDRETECDVSVGLDLASAVAHVGTWRRCSCIITRSPIGRKWPSFRNDPLLRLSDLAESFAVLTLHEPSSAASLHSRRHLFRFAPSFWPARRETK